MSCVTKESPPTSNSYRSSNSNSNYNDDSNSESGSCHTQATTTTTKLRDRNGGERGEITWRAASGNCGLMNIPQ
ncbi:uncharacterized protein LOC113564302 [Drosophila erecta]|uniref:uncharacterized protein LOC113564302 n=1 Tax=Drosophila erecta TaxID=7220 RepID=UPI000F05267C|nr:uncharacterized protein LOC113564302 [Drosophila erecta]